LSQRAFPFFQSYSKKKCVVNQISAKGSSKH
jgi:hypothetical protein